MHTLRVISIYSPTHSALDASILQTSDLDTQIRPERLHPYTVFSKRTHFLGTQPAAGATSYQRLGPNSVKFRHGPRHAPSPSCLVLSLKSRHAFPSIFRWAHFPDLDSTLGTASVAAAKVTPSRADSGSGTMGVVIMAMDKVWFILRLTLPDTWMPSFRGIGGGGSGWRRDLGKARDGRGWWPDGARDGRERVEPSRGGFLRRGGGMSGR